MKKIKIDPKKVIKVKPRMMKEGTVDFNLIFVVILGLIIGMFLVSCENLNDPTPKTPKEQNELSKNAENYQLNVREYRYESCEYIVVDVGSSKWGSHKGNCKNPIHKK